MLHYSIHKHPSSDEWVTFIHGAGGSSSIWFKQIRAFRKSCNILLIDLRGHGRSKMKDMILRPYTFEEVSKDVIEVLDHIGLQKSHFVGISLGTIIIREIADLQPERVSSLIMGGAVLQLDLRSKILVKLGVAFKNILPYMILYKIIAWVILPKKNHKEARILFINEAKKLYQKEFLRWLRLAGELNAKLGDFRDKVLEIPTLYVMGAEDHLFLPTIKKISADQGSSELVIFEKCGHVVNVEQPDLFNLECLKFLSNLRLSNSSQAPSEA